MSRNREYVTSRASGDQRCPSCGGYLVFDEETRARVECLGCGGCFWTSDVVDESVEVSV